MDLLSIIYVKMGSFTAYVLFIAERKYIQGRMRKRIETVFSEITALFPKTISAVTGQGFEIKIFNFILAYIFWLFFKLRVALA